jgi:uncharacterized cupredoxin-like copper-binding protein
MTPGHVTARGVVVIAAVVAVLAGASTVAVAAAAGAFRSAYTAPSGACSAPSNLPGTVVNVTVTNMGREMIAGSGVMGGMMRIFVDRAHVPAGTVSLRVANTGSLVHELVVLPLPPGQQVGERPVGNDNTVDETGSLGEASKTCGSGAGDGIDPGAIGWVTLSLPAGNYELICNLSGHYTAGMYTELTVS